MKRGNKGVKPTGKARRKRKFRLRLKTIRTVAVWVIRLSKVKNTVLWRGVQRLRQLTELDKSA